MNLDRNDIEIEEVLYRYFRNELSNKEKVEVDAWRTNAAENEEKFSELKLMFLDLKGFSYYKSIGELNLNPEKSWENFRQTNNVRSIKPTSYLHYAASIVVIISAAIGIYLYQNQPTEITLAEITEVQDVQLADGSEISLNEGSSLQYVEPFQNNERRLKLEGEAYFKVSKNPDKPFVVEVENVEVRVLGTRFYINRPEANQVDVLVEEGKVLVSYNDQHEIVEIGQSLSVNTNENTLTETIEHETGVDTFWKTRKLVFDLTSIQEVVEVINKAYDSSVSLEGPTEDCALTVTFDNESFDNVLEVISSTLNYEVVKDQGSIILKGDGCK